MKFKGTAALAVLFVGIVLYYFLVDIPSEKRKKDKKDRAEKIVLFNSKNVETISFAKKENTITLKRINADQWLMTKPVEAKADSSAISNFLSFLGNLNFSRVVEDPPKNSSDFGLDTPSLKVLLSMDGGETKGIQVGDDHPMGNKIYLSTLDSKRVLIADISRNRLDQKTYDLRDKTILNFESSQVEKIEFIRNEKILRLKKNKESWQLSEGDVSAKGNKNEITNLLNSLRTAKVKQFVIEQPRTLDLYGLKKPQLTLKLTTSASNDPLVLIVGEKTEEGAYAKTLSKENIFIVRQSLFDTLNNRELVDFLDKSLVDFKDSDVTKVTLSMDKNLAELIRDKDHPDKWSMIKPENMKANTATINSLLFDLKNTRILEFAKTQTKSSKILNLKEPEKEITLTYKNGKTWTLKVSSQASKIDHYYAKRSGEETVFTLQKSSIESIFRSLYDLKDRAILELDDDVIKQIQIEDTKQTFILKKAAKKWVLALPKSENSIQNFVGKDILWTLNSLEFESILAKDPGSMFTGLSNPLISLKLSDEGGSILTHVLIGNPVTTSTKTHYLKLAKSSTIYTIKKRSLDKILDNLQKIREKL